MNPIRLSRDTIATGLSWLLTGVIVLVVCLFSALIVRDYGRENAAAQQTLLEKGSVLIRALESGTAGLHVPTGEVRDFPTNTSDALTSGGTFAIAGAVQRMWDNLRGHCGEDPVCYMTGGAGWKMAPSMSTPCELVDSLIFDGLLEIADRRFSPLRA